MFGRKVNESISNRWCGFVSTNLVKRLLKDGYEVTSVDNYSTDKKENHQNGCTYHSYDLSSDHVFESYVDHQGYPIWREIDYDVIFHLVTLTNTTIIS